MTVYAINYTNRLNEMLNNITAKYGTEHNRTILFANMVEKRINQPCYQNREELEQYYKGWMR